MNNINDGLYDYYIAKAAKEYIEELVKVDVKITDPLLLKLNWLILAEKNGWKPNIYDQLTPEQKKGI